jgi:hypothetical protein
MLLGLTAVSVPIILHFFYRARYRPVDWGAMKFLRLSVEQTSRRLRFQELILLILRILVCLLLALVFLRLVFGSGGEVRERGKTVDAILVIDTSYSMAAKQLDDKGRPQSRFELAKEKATKIIDDLPAGSTVRIIACSDRATIPTHQMPANRDQAKRVIDSLQITHEKTDLLPGFNGALAALKECRGDTKEVYLFSDMQRLGWERQSTAIRARCEEIRNSAMFSQVRCGGNTIRNVTITSIEPQVDIPMVGMRIPFTVMLRNSGTEELTNLKLTTEVDGEPLEKDAQTIASLKPGETRPFTVTAKLEKPGLSLVKAVVGPDDLDVDNHVEVAVAVREKVRVLVVDGAPTESGIPQKAGSYYLSTALTPVAPDQLDSYYLQQKVIRSVDAIPDSLNDMDLCILVDVPLLGAEAPPNEFLNALQNFVQSGHSLMITSGTKVSLSRREYNQNLGELLPAVLEDRDPVPAPVTNPYTPDLDSIDRTSFLAKFEKGTDLGDKLSKADTMRVLPLIAPKPADPGQVLIRFTDGEPMLMVRQVDAGKVYLLTTSVFPNQSEADLWSYLGINVAFVPFVDKFVVSMLQRQSNTVNKLAGEVLTWEPPDRNANYYLLKPPTSAEDHLSDRFVLLGKPSFLEKSFRIDDTGMSGIYRIGSEEYRNRLLERERSGAPLDEAADANISFSVLPDLRESQSLENMTDSQIDDLLGFAPVRKSDVPEWTPYVLIALLIFALGETVWAWYCGRAW